MTNDLRERVAQAIFDASTFYGEWDRQSRSNRDVCRDMADAAIAEMGGARVLLELLETRTKDAPISATAMEAVWQATFKEVGFSAVRGFLRALAEGQSND